MAIKFEKIQPGMMLWSRGRVREGRTTMRKTAEWQVHVKDVWPEARTALVSWNGNPYEVWSERRLARLYTTQMAKKRTP